MKAIILAAGQGTRLRPYTADRPKCLVELAGKTLLAHQTRALEAAAVSDITVVTGYRHELIGDLGLQSVHNPRYAQTNMVVSMMCAAHLFEGDSDLLVVYGDLVFEPRVIRKLLDSKRDFATTVDDDWLALWKLRAEDPLGDAETLRISPQGDILELGNRPRSLEEIDSQYVGLIKFSAGFAPQVERHYRALRADPACDPGSLDQMYMTSFLQQLIDRGHALQAVRIRSGWLEVDSVADLELYNRMAVDGTLSRFVSLEEA